MFTLHGVDGRERPVLRRNLRRQDLVGFFERLPPAEVVLEACGGSHHWGRTLGALGHSVWLIPPQYVTPFVKRSKNDRNDAEAISEAASRPGMREVAVKSAEQQAEAMLLSVQELLTRQRTRLVNALRGHAAEFGLVAPLGRKGVGQLRAEIAADATLPRAAAAALDLRLAGIPGVGPIVALHYAVRVDPWQFKSGRHFAAWLGLVPRERSTGGRQRLGGISRAGNERLRQLLVLGATAVIRHARPGRPGVSAWLLALLQRRPRKLAAVALANKMARIVWAMMTRGEAYRQPPITA